MFYDDRIMPVSLPKIATALCVASVLVECKDQTAGSKEHLPDVSEHEQRYYAFQLRAYQDRHGQRKFRQLSDTSWHDVELRVAVRFSPGHGDMGDGYSNPFIEVRNMDDPSDCHTVESRHDPDSDPPIYAKAKAKTDYRKRLDFHATLASGRVGEAKMFTFLWFWGKQSTSYGIMKRLQITQTYPDKRSVYFLTDKQIKLSPDDIAQRFFSAKADKTCAQAAAQNRVNNPPVEGVWYHAFVLPRLEGTGKGKKLLHKNKKIVLRLAFRLTKGGGQHVQVIVRDLDKPSSCHVFTKYAQTLDWRAHDDRLYDKHIVISKKFGDSSRYYLLTWLLDKEKRARIDYFYLDERAGGPFHEYSPAGNASFSIPALALSRADIAARFPAANPAEGCVAPQPQQH